MSETETHPVLRFFEKPVMPTRRRVLDVVRDVAKESGYTVEELTGPSRAWLLAKARHHAMWRARQETGRSLSEIGRVFGGRDHSTVLHAIQKIGLLPVEQRGVAPTKPVLTEEETKKIYVKILNGDGKTYYGAPCKHGHLSGLRYMKSNRCVACARLESSRRYYDKLNDRYTWNDERNRARAHANDVG